ncbi:MAG: hypothetical protein ACMXYC_00900 [Candidatus Woesearchaeota archaeon]
MNDTKKLHNTQHKKKQTHIHTQHQVQHLPEQKYTPSVSMSVYTILLCCIALIISATVQATPLISGVMYNPPGPDTGHEWVDLYNPLNQTYTGYCSLDFGDAIREDKWHVQWEGVLTMPPHSFIMIGDEFTDFDIQAVLRLQNGPDGLRLVCDDSEVDKVGWGDIQFPEYYLGAPMLDIREGFVLSRKFIEGIPLNTQHNANDFEMIHRDPHKAQAHQEQVGLIDIILDIANSPPTIHNLTCDTLLIDDVYQVTLLLDAPTTIICTMTVHDDNGLEDILHYQTILQHNNTLIQLQEFSIDTTTHIQEFSIVFDKQSAPHIYTLDISISDSNATTTTSVDFYIQPIIGLHINPNTLSWNNIRPLQRVTPQTVVFENKGHTPLQLSLQNTFGDVYFEIHQQQHNTTLQTTLTLDGILQAQQQRSIDIEPILQRSMLPQRLEGALLIHIQ